MNRWCLLKHAERITGPTPVWDVAIVCEDPKTADHAEWLLREVLPSTGLSVQCKTRVMSLGRMPAPALLGAAIQETADADLVIFSTYGRCSASLDDDQWFGEWSSMSGALLCPMVSVVFPGDADESSRYDFLTALQRWREHPDCPCFTSFSDALFGAWDHWHVKRLALGRSTAFVPIDKRMRRRIVRQPKATEADRVLDPNRQAEMPSGAKRRRAPVPTQRLPRSKALQRKF